MARDALGGGGRESANTKTGHPQMERSGTTRSGDCKLGPDEVGELLLKPVEVVVAALAPSVLCRIGRIGDFEFGINTRKKLAFGRICYEFD